MNPVSQSRKWTPLSPMVNTPTVVSMKASDVRLKVALWPSASILHSRPSLHNCSRPLLYYGKFIRRLEVTVPVTEAPIQTKTPDGQLQTGMNKSEPKADLYNQMRQVPIEKAKRLPEKIVDGKKAIG